MNLILREALKSDMKDVLELIRELAIFEKEEQEVEVSVDELVNDGFGDRPSFKVFVADLDSKIVGMALFYERYSTWKGRIIHLEDLIVKKSYRNRGLGKALYAKVMAYAHEKGFKRVSWEVLDWNKVAIDFYESTGASVINGWQVVHMREANLKEFVQQNAKSEKLL